MEYSIYILQSLVDQSYYIGYTQNIDQRLVDHNSGKSRYTSKKKPWKLVYQETYSTKGEALKREKFLKNQRNRSFYNQLISNKI